MYEKLRIFTGHIQRVVETSNQAGDSLRVWVIRIPVESIEFYCKHGSVVGVVNPIFCHSRKIWMIEILSQNRATRDTFNDVDTIAHSRYICLFSNH